MKRIIKRLSIGLLLLFVCLGLVAWLILNYVLVRPPSYSPARLENVELLSWPRHDAIYQNTEFPYVLSLESQNGSLEYIGARHTSDAAEPQLKEIERRWDTFQPTVAFCEGRARMFRFASRPETGKLSESELVRILAYRNGVTLYTLEPTYEDEVTYLLEKFEPRLVATYMTLRVFCAESKGNDQNADSLAAGLMKKRTAVAGLRGSLQSIAELDQYWGEKFPDAPDWRTLSDTDSVPLLRKIGDRSREVRGAHMVSSIVELVESGERVLAVVGASHVIRQEPVLRRLLGENAEE